MKSFDIIIIGAGLSGLSLTLEILKRTNKKILILEKKKKLVKDKNFCFWNFPQNYFTNQSDTTWRSIKIKEKNKTLIKTDEDFYYCHLSSKTFYRNCMNLIRSNKNAKILFDQKIYSTISNDTKVLVNSNNNIFKTELLFDSRPKKIVKNKLLQHFYGVEVTSKRNIFKENEVTLMDLQPSKLKTHFFYVLPYKKNKALIENTYFSKTIMSKNRYKIQIAEYLKKSFPNETFKIGFEEFGIIPMYKIKEDTNKNDKIIKIGTSANWVRISTGYSFQNSFYNSRIIVDKILKKKKNKYKQ